MLKQDIEFLAELSRELKEQDNFETRKPLSFHISEKVREYGFGEGYADGYELVEDGDVVGYKDSFKVNPAPVFLTHRSAREYIDKFGYNHSKPHTYAMHVDRSPEYERLLDIIENTDWESLVIEVGEEE